MRVGGWRLAAASAIAIGLAASPFVPVAEGPERPVVVLACLLVLLVPRARFGPLAASLVLAAGLLVGLTAGSERLAAIDGDSLSLPAGEEVRLDGWVETAPRLSRGKTRFVFDSEAGRVMVESSGPVGRLPVGSGVTVAGKIRRPPDWFRPNTLRQGISKMLIAETVAASGQSRGGIAGVVDRLRIRAETSLGRSMPEREAALARGFVLGQDQEIDPVTVADFQGSGLAHLLAVSGQNVVLLSLLGLGVMAVAGVGHRSRLYVLAILIALYVPLAGGGPSIQRAGVMGLAGLAALAVSRPTSRSFVLALAAAATLLLNPRAAADVGWQLSFAAVAGIAILARPTSRRLAGVFSGSGELEGRPSRQVSIVLDGVAVSIAASVVTAPLMAFHFDRIPVGSIAANLLALPAVAPAMWLGMASAAIGLLWDGFAVPLNLFNSVLLAYIAQVATWFGRPEWTVAELEIASVHGLIAVYVALAAMVATTLRLTRSLAARPAVPDPARQARRLRGAAVLLLAVVLSAVLLVPGHGRRQLDAPAPGQVRIDFLDVGQGDATLIRTAGLDPILVDGGAPGSGIEAALDSAGVGRVATVIATHADLDHIGGLYDVFASRDVGSFFFDGSPAALLNQVRRGGSDPVRISDGDRFRFGPLVIDVLWPPPRQPGFVAPEDRNVRSIMLLLTCRGYRILLTGDGEAEAVPVDPGSLDVLRVAHHGSDDAGLPALLDRTMPVLSVISAGSDNPYGHPTGETLAQLSESGSRVLRTDRDGTVSLTLGREGVSVESGR